MYFRELIKAASSGLPETKHILLGVVIIFTITLIVAYLIGFTDKLKSSEKKVNLKAWKE
jgi:hypothetical protein